MNICPEGFTEVVEGLARLCAPDPRLYIRMNGVYEPAWAPVFYNPNMVENRDIAVGVVDYVSSNLGREFIFIDPLAATGVRGIRIALEVSKPSTIRGFMGDISDQAFKLMMVNVRMNKLEDRIIVEKADANEYLYKLRRLGTKIDYVDIDPFGSPAQFTYSAISCVRNGGIVAFTATDLAVLEGKYRDKMLRRYGVLGFPTPISKDIAVRVLLSYIARIAFSMDRYVEPILSYVYKHYARVYLQIREGASKADKQLKSCLKSLAVCSYCGFSYIIENTDEQNSSGNICPFCVSPTVTIKPIWVCRTAENNVVQNIANRLEMVPWIQRSTKVLLEKLQKYATIDSITIRLTLLARSLHTDTPARDKVIKCLNEIGYKAVESYTYGDGIVTMATASDIIKCVK